MVAPYSFFLEIKALFKALAIARVSAWLELAELFNLAGAVIMGFFDRAAADFAVCMRFCFQVLAGEVHVWDTSPYFVIIDFGRGILIL